MLAQQLDSCAGQLLTGKLTVGMLADILTTAKDHAG
ncbi:hypothetical protein KIPE111705_35840 [Kibdelosporangium persicum]